MLGFIKKILTSRGGYGIVNYGGDMTNDRWQSFWKTIPLYNIPYTGGWTEEQGKRMVDGLHQEWIENQKKYDEYVQIHGRAPDCHVSELEMR